MKFRNTLRLGLVVLAMGAIATAVRFLPMKEYFGSLLATIESFGRWGPVLLAAAYIVACVLAIPGSILTLGAGFLFGVVRGTIAVSIGSVLGATAAFLIGRTLLRNNVEQRIKAYPKFRAIDRAVGAQGFKIVLLTRLSPLFPFNVLNYAFGLTDVKLSRYMLASWIGMLPATIMFVYLGSALKSLAEVASEGPTGGTPQTVFFMVGLVMAIITTTVITRVARRALNEAVAEDSASFQAGEEAGTLRSGNTAAGVD